jgi:hypothetical protein
MGQTKPENQKFLWHFPKCQINPNLDWLIAYLLLIWLKIKSTINLGVLELTRLIQTTLMEHRNLWEIICPKKPPPSSIDNQIPLFNFCAGH